jgi:hypothetical protein
MELLAIVLKLISTQAELAGCDDCAAEHGKSCKTLEDGGAGVVLEL